MTSQYLQNATILSREIQGLLDVNAVSSSWRSAASLRGFRFCFSKFTSCLFCNTIFFFLLMCENASFCLISFLLCTITENLQLDLILFHCRMSCALIMVVVLLLIMYVQMMSCFLYLIGFVSFLFDQFSYLLFCSFIFSLCILQKK